MQTKCPSCQHVFEAKAHVDAVDLRNLQNFLNYVTTISCFLLDIDVDQLKRTSRLREIVSARKLICYFIYTSTKTNKDVGYTLPKEFLKEINLKSHASIYTHYYDLKGKVSVYKRFGIAITQMEELLKTTILGADTEEKLMEIVNREKQLIRNVLTNNFINVQKVQTPNL